MTSSSGSSGTPSRATARGHDVARVTELLEEILLARVFLHPHPAPPELLCGVRVRPGGGNLAEIFREPRGGLIGGRVAPGVVGLDDVDSLREIHHTLRTKLRAMPVQRMRQGCKAPHALYVVHRPLRCGTHRDPARDDRAPGLR